MAASFRKQENIIPSSSPAFGTPVHPIINPRDRPLPPPAFKPAIATILPILLPPARLRTLAFRIFTKKHNLTLSSPALQALATFIGKHCGSEWREKSTAEAVLDEVAKTWKKSGGSLIVDDGQLMKNILKTLEGCMTGGKIVQPKTGLNRQSSFAFASDMTDPAEGGARPTLEHHGSSFGISGLQVDEEEEDATTLDPRSWLKIVHAYEQPRLVYDMNKKHFEKVTTKPSLLPPPSHKTTLFRDRYNIIHQRLMRSEAFQAPSVNQRSLARSDSTSVQQFYKITPISNLLGRNGSSHVILGLLTVTPTGTLALNDMTGSIILDLQHAKPIRGDHSAWFCPGMIILIEGVYEEEYSGAGASGLGNTTGVGGTIGGKFIGFMISGPPSEKRSLSLGVPDASTGDVNMGGAFGWADFLGLGSERAMGPKMRRLEQKILGPDSPSPERKKMIMMNEVNLDDPSALEALRSVLALYASEAEEIPLSFVLIGNFVSHPVMAGGGSGGSIDYKEYFNDLATVLVDYPSLLRNATWVFVPGDNDPWPSAYSAGASTAVPRKEIPALFTSRIKRAFAVAKAEAGVKREDGPDGEVIWTSNPARISLFGSAHEVVVFRDDISGRLRRTAITFGRAARQEEAEEQGADNDANDEAMQDANPPRLGHNPHPRNRHATRRRPAPNPHHHHHHPFLLPVGKRRNNHSLRPQTRPLPAPAIAPLALSPRHAPRALGLRRRAVAVSAAAHARAGGCRGARVRRHI